MWPDWLYHLFCTLSYERPNFGEYLINTKCVSKFCTNFVCNTLYSDNNSAGYYHNCTYIFTYITHFLLIIQSRLNFLQILEKSSYIYYITRNFVRLKHSSSMRTERRTDTPDDADSHFSQTFELLIYFVCQLQYRQLQYRHDTQPVLSTTSYCSSHSTQL